MRAITSPRSTPQILQAEGDARHGAVILRVTKVSPRTGLSWLKRMPFEACMP